MITTTNSIACITTCRATNCNHVGNPLSSKHINTTSPSQLARIPAQHPRMNSITQPHNLASCAISRAFCAMFAHGMRMCFSHLLPCCCDVGCMLFVLVNGEQDVVLVLCAVLVDMAIRQSEHVASDMYGVCRFYVWITHIYSSPVHHASPLPPPRRTHSLLRTRIHTPPPSPCTSCMGTTTRVGGRS